MAVESRQLLGALNCWRLAKWSRICCLLCLCQDAGRPGWFLFLRENRWAWVGGGRQPLAAAVRLPTPLCWVAVASRDWGNSPGWSGQLCPFPGVSYSSRILVTSLLPSTGPGCDLLQPPALPWQG